jgi:L-xylulose reductase
MKFKHKKVLITGAGSGIGRALSIRMSELGADVFAVSKTESHLMSLRAERPTIKTICVDLSDWQKTRETLSELPAMDYLVNNAGMGMSKPFLEITEEELDNIYAVNVKPIVNVSQIVVKKMVAENKPGFKI